MQHWVKDGLKKAAGVSIKTCIDMPDDLIESFTKMYTQAMNLVPKGEQDW